MKLKNMNMLSKTELAIISHLARLSQELYGREIAKNLGLSTGGVNQALNRLYKTGLLKRAKRGGLYFYSLEQSALIKQFKIFLTLFELETLFKKLKPTSYKVILYGSCAVGDDTNQSDVDLVIISGNKEAVESLIKDFSSKYSRKIQKTVVTPNEWLEYKSKDKVFYDNVNKGIVLWRRSYAERI